MVDFQFDYMHYKIDVKLYELNHAINFSKTRDTD